MTNDHSVRSPSADGGGALQRTLSETSNTVRAGMREALDNSQSLLAAIHLTGADEWCWQQDGIAGLIVEQIAENRAALQLPAAEIQSSGGSALSWPTNCVCCHGPLDGNHQCPICDTQLHPSEANSPAAPVKHDRNYGSCAVCGLYKEASQCRAMTPEVCALYPHLNPKIAIWECSARKQSLPDPSDCSWPTCGCDPHADRVISALEEQGFGAPAPVDAGVREALENKIDDILSIMLGRVMHCGELPHVARKDAATAVRAALSSQPVVGVDQKETPLTMPESKQNI